MRQKTAYKPNFHALDDLTEKGFLRRVVSGCGKLVLYNYTDKCVYKRKWTKHTLNSRGNVYEIATGKVIARSFPKFFNFEELPVTRQRGLTKLKDFSVFEKMDGSLGIHYHYDGRWHANTRGSFASDQAIQAEKMMVEKYHFDDAPKHITVLTEIIYPDNKIIVDYGKEEKLVLLAAYNNYNGQELSWEELIELSAIIGLERPKKYDFRSIDEIVHNQLSLPAHEEGFVVRLADGDRIKFKSKEYLKLARLMNYVTPLHFWEHMENGKIKEELLQIIPEELRDISDGIRKELEKEYRVMRDRVYSDVNNILEETKDAEDQKKAIGLRLGEPRYKYANCAFLVLDNKTDKIDRYIMLQIRPKGNEYVAL